MQKFDDDKPRTISAPVPGSPEAIEKAVKAQREWEARERERERLERQQLPERIERYKQQQWQRTQDARMAAADAERRAAEIWQAALEEKLSKPIPLVRREKGIVLGTQIEDGEDIVIKLAALQHTLIAGVTGSGKSIILHQFVSQLVQAAEVERLVLIDLKGGVEFNRYRESAKVQVIWEYRDVVTVIEQLVTTMNERQDLMREQGLQNWPGGRTFVIIDEYAEIQSDIDAAEGKEEKAIAKRLSGNLVRIARRARALGIVLICALQKPTLDAMDSALRTNLSCRICLRVASSQLAASILDDLDDLPADPCSLPTGRFIYYNTSRGVIRHLQAHVAPGLDLGRFS